MYRYLYLFVPCAFIIGCSSTPEEVTLASVDIVDSSNLQADVFVPHKTEEEIKQAYYNYINNAQAGERARLHALNRLAEMEIAKANQALKASPESTGENATEDEVYLESLRRTLDLLQTSIRDYPKDPDNDKVLYRLARIHDQLGNGQESLAALGQLVAQFPQSPHYAEAQFRLAERAFLEEDYIAAEDAYSEVIYSLNNNDLRQRAYFKRGWSRYKQGLYADAADDHLAAIREQNFGTYESLDDNERRLFDEHFRAMALAFAQHYDADRFFSFFSSPDDGHYLYHTSRAMADVYLQQERFSDAAAVLREFVMRKPQAQHAALAHLRVIDIWKSAKFRNQYLQEVEAFYTAYNPSSNYWNSGTAPQDVDLTQLKDHILFSASHFHRLYSEKKADPALQQATLWYDRYLEHYNAYARKDNIYVLYGDLLASVGRKGEAVDLYEQAGFDNNIILDKTAAYATISLTYELYESAETSTRAQWLEKHLTFATRYAKLYPKDADAQDVALHAAQAAFKAQDYQQTVLLSNLINDVSNDKARQTAQVLKARALLEQQQFVDAEEILASLLEINRLQVDQQLVQDNLALAIYRRGDQAKQDGDAAKAVAHYARVAAVVPRSGIAPQALYDAVVLAMDNELWSNAIAHMETFEKQFPNHKHADDVTRRLSTAYMNSQQYAAAAKALEKVSGSTEDDAVQMAALWKAAELYEAEGDIEGAIRTYRSYAHTYSRPYPQFMEAMFKLTQLYAGLKDDYRRNFWQQKIVDADRSAPDSVKTERTNFVAASAWLTLAKGKHEAFRAVALVEPLPDNLRKKKQHMEEAIELYSQASVYNLAEVSTESTYAIAAIYRHFAEALLESERPANLKGTELAQYEILIEDQAFPFEEMAVEFHEINLSRLAQGTVNQWITASLGELKALFPARYGRKGKVALYEGKGN